MTIEDVAVGALCAWKENRGGGAEGMQSVINVLCNRAASRGTCVAAEALRPWQFSSMTAKGDPQLGIGPNALNSLEWADYTQALSLAQQAADGTLEDITGGAVSYFALTMAVPPGWAKAMQQTCVIAGQVFFK